MSDFRFPDPEQAVEALLERLAPTQSERIPLAAATGRVLAEPLRADRDSPPCDASAMDGFAVRAAEAGRGRLPIAGAVAIGAPAPVLPPGAALRIVTGAPIPAGADAILRHEDAEVIADAVTASKPLAPNLHIRRQAENAPCGAEIVPEGTEISPAVASALASFGIAQPLVHRVVRTAMIITGDELLPVEATPQPWQIRDGNGAALTAMLAGMSFVHARPAIRIADELAALTHACECALASHDALLLTGGVSMGERDLVPEALRGVGVEVLFHRLPQRPGKPILTGIGPAGQVVLALPGNPLSVLVTARRFAVPALRRRAGCAVMERVASVALEGDDEMRIPLWWHRPVRLIADGRAELLQGRGSGDLALASRSDGFIELPPNAGGSGPWPFRSWRS